MPAANPRMIEATFRFQAPPPGGGEDVAQFDVRLFLRDGKLRVAIDLHGADNGIVEDLDVSVFDAVRSAIETVKGRVKAAELHEQIE